MKCAFQVVRATDGVRSPEAVTDRVTFANLIREVMSAHPDSLSSADFVICLLEDVGEPGARVSYAPLLSVGSFIQQFASTEVPSDA